jgi:hypothetical protein
MAHFALHLPVVNKNTDSSSRFALSALKELPVRLVFKVHLVVKSYGAVCRKKES